jgi:histone deacetylase complex subunit SAP30
MPPKKQHTDDTQAIKEKLQGSRNPRNGRANAPNGSSLKEVDNASVGSGQTSGESNLSNVSFVSGARSSFHTSLLHEGSI